jgi:Zn-dependent alcohol dehydrogenase
MPLHATAAVLDRFAAPFAHVPVTLRDPAPDEVVVRTAAAPFCSTDWMGWRAMRGKVPPVVLGHTLVGTVELAGPHTEFAPGDRVLVAGTPQCETCFYCRVGRPDQCAQLLEGGDPVIGHLGDGRDVRAAGGVGAYSTHALVMANQVHRVPDSLPHEVAALMGCGISTAYGVVENIAGVEAGQSVAVVGLGHLGQLTVQAAAAAGASTVVGIDLHPERLELATAMGATHVVDAGHEDPVEVVRGLTEGRGADPCTRRGRPSTWHGVPGRSSSPGSTTRGTPR